MSKKGAFFYKFPGVQPGHLLRFILPVAIVFGFFSGSSYAFQNSDMLSQNHRWENNDSGQFIDVKKQDGEDYFVSLNIENMELTLALQALTSQIKVGLSYDADADLDHTISLRVENAAFYDVLDQMLQETGLEYLVAPNRNALVIRPRKEKEPELQETVTGIVTDAQTGEALPGVNVVISGAEELTGSIVGTQTDINGEYVLHVPEGLSILIFSYIGYETLEVEIDGRTEIDVVLLPITISGDELVVIGYGTARQRDVTGSVSSVSPERLENERPNSIQDILRGNIPGLNVGYSTSAKGGGSLQVRGRNSLTASTDPLIVLDGTIYPGQLSDINPNDIESIDVLKDASSAAVFGANAASGAILITTTKGGRSDRPTVRINSSVGVATMSVRQPVYGPEEFVSWREDVMKSIHAGGYEPHQFSDPHNLPSDVSLEQWLSYDGSSGDPIEVWLRRLSMEPVEIENYLAGRSVDWVDMLYQDGLRQDHNISLSGTRDELQYYWSLGYLRNEGIVVGDEFTTLRTRLNLQGRVSNFLSVGLNTHFADRDESAIAVSWGLGRVLSPWASEYDENGDYKWRPNNEASGGNHPYYNRSHRDRLWRERNLHAVLFAELDLPYGIRFRTNFTPRYVFIEDFDHRFATHEEWGGRGGIASRRQYSVFHWQVDNILTWNRNFDNIHNFNVTLLSNAEKYQNWENTMENSEFDPQDNLGYHNIGAGTHPIIGSNDQYHTADALMGRVLYSLHDRYTLSLSVRRDGYSAFGQHNPRATFPAAAFGWLFTEEPFFKRSWLDYGRLRFSWGSSGNRDIGRYAALSDLRTGKYFYERPDGTLYQVNQLLVESMANANLKWERTTSVNAGFDFSLFNRIDGSVDVYEMSTTDLLVQRNLPDILGFNWVFDNLGEVKNRGFEINLNSRNIMREKFTWRSTFNFQLNRNEIVSLYGDFDEDGNELDDYENQWFIGRSIDEIWHYRTLGIWQTHEAEEAARYGVRPGDYKVEDVNGDGVFTREDRQFLGYTEPRFRWSLRNEFRLYRNFDFSFMVYSYWGHMSSFNQLKNRDGFLDRTNSYVLPYWTEDNPNNEWARLYSSEGGAGNFNVYRERSFIRLENVSLAYTLPYEFVQKFSIQNLRLYMNVRNVATYAPEWDFWDPENTGPTPRYFTFGIDITL